jgi:hypothetical protein
LTLRGGGNGIGIWGPLIRPCTGIISERVTYEQRKAVKDAEFATFDDSPAYWRAGVRQAHGEVKRVRTSVPDKLERRRARVEEEGGEK